MNVSTDPIDEQVLDCYGQRGPAEALGFFARAHDVPLDRLLRKTVACHVRIGPACRQVGREPREVIEALNRACAVRPHKLRSLPMVSVS